MDLALGWVGEFVDFFVSLFPHWIIVRSNEEAVKFSRGKKVKILKPGVRWYWPPFTDIEGPFPVCWQPMPTSTLYLMDKENTPVAARGFVVFRIVDVRKYVVDHDDADSCIDDVVGACIRDVITSKKLDEIQQNDRKTTDNALTREAKKALEEFGIEVRHVRLTTFTTSKMLSVIGDMDAPVVDDDQEDE